VERPLTLGYGVAGPQGPQGPAGTAGSGQNPAALSNGLNSNIATGNQPTVRLAGPTAAFSVGGFQENGAVTPLAGQQLAVTYAGGQGMTVVNEDVSSAATARIATPGGSDVFIPAGARITLCFDPTILTTGRWVLVSVSQRPTVYDIRDFGAKCNWNGSTGNDDGPAINLAIAAAAAAGGGTVFVPLNTSFATQVVIGGVGNPVSGVGLKGPAKPQAGYQTHMIWTGGSTAAPAVLVRDAAGGFFENVKIDANGGAAYCLQFRQVNGTDAYAVENWHQQRCCFINATTDNVLIGDVLANQATSTDDCSNITFDQCYFAATAAGNTCRTRSHVMMNAGNGFGNAIINSQFWSSASNLPGGAAVATITHANPGVVTTTGNHGFTSGDTIVFKGTGTNYDVTATSQNGYQITVTGPNTFTVPADSGSASSAGTAYEQGFPLIGVYASLGRIAVDHSVLTPLGIAGVYSPGVATAVNVAPGSCSLSHVEAQCANMLWVDAGSGTGAPLFPFLVDDCHHTDISGYGLYSIYWARGIYASCNVTGGFLGRGFTMAAAQYNANILGTQFSASLGTTVGGADASYVTGWWNIDGTRTVQTGAGNAFTPFAAPSTVSGQARLASTSTLGIDLWSLGTTIQLGINNAIAGIVTNRSNFLNVNCGTAYAGVALDATGSTSHLIQLLSGTSQGNGYFDIGIINVRHGDSSNQYLTIADGAAYSGGPTDAQVLAGGVMNLDGGSGTKIRGNGTLVIQVDSSGHLAFFGGTPQAQAGRAGQLTSGAGAPSTGTVDVGSVPTQANCNNNFATLVQRINALETIIHNLGLSA